MTELPYVDTHSVVVRQPSDVVWTAVESYARGLGLGRRNRLSRLLGTDPRAGFAVVEAVPGERLVLVGRHRFSTYRLVFELGPATAEGVTVSALTYAAFPRLRGRAYRAMVIGSHAHALLTDQMVRSIRRWADNRAARS